MKAGDVINGYTVLEDFKVVGAGLSKWTFAERGGRQFFIKEFLSPTYPDDSSARQRQRPRPRSGRDVQPSRLTTEACSRRFGALVRVRRKPDRHAGLLPLGRQVLQGERRRSTPQALERRRTWPPGLSVRKLVLMKSVAHSLKILHDLRIVHGDLKPSNILIKRTELGYTSKLIDFDNSYIAGRPAARGRDRRDDQLLLSRAPRLHPGGRRVSRRSWDFPSDVFALGLIYTEFLTGAPPVFRRRHPTTSQPWRFVAASHCILDPISPVPQPLTDLVNEMLAADPARRPSIAAVHATLMTLRPAAAAPTPATTSTALRGKGLRAGSGDTGDAAPPASSGLIGKLVHKMTDRPRG